MRKTHLAVAGRRGPGRLRGPGRRGRRGRPGRPDRPRRLWV